MTLPGCCPFECPLVTTTSSSLRIGIERQLYFCLSSFDNDELISFLLTLLGAVKWRFLCFLREELIFLLNFIFGRERKKAARVVYENVRGRLMGVSPCSAVPPSLLGVSVPGSPHPYLSQLTKMSFLKALFSGREKNKRKEYNNITRDVDPMEQWNKLSELGDGAFGKVYKVRLADNLVMDTGWCNCMYTYTVI